MDLVEIFQGNSDKARLITTIIGVIIALSVVGINQFFNSKRSRKCITNWVRVTLAHKTSLSDSVYKYF